MRFTDYISQYVNELQSGTRCKHRHAIPVAAKTTEGYRMVGRVISRFESASGRRYDIDEVGMEFQRLFVGWCNSRNMKSNTVRQYLVLTRVLMNGAVRDHLCSNLEFRMPEFIPLRTESELLILSKEMIDDLITHHFKGKKLTEARDIFIVGYLTGQRFSDYSRISTDMYVEINGKKLLRIIQRKTKTEVYIPLDINVDKTLKKYGGSLPKTTLREFDQSLKSIAAEMGWTNMPKLTSHTARRSLATNAYAAGIPLSSIMCITGHTREEDLRKYLHLTSDQLALQAARDLYG